ERVGAAVQPRSCYQNHAKVAAVQPLLQRGDAGRWQILESRARLRQRTSRRVRGTNRRYDGDKRTLIGGCRRREDAAMHCCSWFRAAPFALLGTLLYTAGAHAQAIPGFVNLPRDDFVWIWGDREDAMQNRFSDFTVNGNEAGFRCELTDRLHPGSRLSP